jgi:hypothetical protein
MAARGWAGSVLTAIGAAAGAAAAQLGLGYGLGIIAWVPANEAASQSVWLASLAWVLWVGATSTVVGAIVADRLSARTALAHPPGRFSGLLDVAWRVVVALAAAIGALIVVPLVAVPARNAHRVDNFAPQVTAGGYAVVGVILGLLVAVAALSARAITANVIASASWLWALAVVAVIDEVRAGRGPGTAQLAIWQFTQSGWWRELYVPGALLTLLVALLVGVLAAWPAGRRGDNRVGVAISGAVGPLLVAVAYFLAAPRLTGVPSEQKSAYLMAPYAVIAGLAGSVLVAAIGPKGLRAARAARATAEPPVKDELSDWARSLSNVDAKAAAEEPETERLPASGVDSRAAELEPDSYAPARAYATDTVDAPSTGTGTGTATGRATVTDQPAKEPLWPESAKPGKGKGPKR